MPTIKEEIGFAVAALAEVEGWGAFIGHLTPQAEVSIKTNGSAMLIVETPEGEKSVRITRSLRAEIVNQ